MYMYVSAYVYMYVCVCACRYTSRRDFSFDNTLKAMLTMFEVLTLEGWLDVRDMLLGDTVTPGIPRTQEAWVRDPKHSIIYMYNYIGEGTAIHVHAGRPGVLYFLGGL